MTDDIVTRSQQHGTHHGNTGTDAEYIEYLELKLAQAADEIERLREWKAVANMFGECFRMDEFGQSPVSDGQDVFQATLAWERLRTKAVSND